MTIFNEILDDELFIAGKSDNDQLGDVRLATERAAERYANQQTRDLEDKILTYRQELVGEPDSYDEHFGITFQKGGL